MTTITIVSDLHGTYWWPTGEVWTKPVRETFAVVSDPIHTVDSVSTVREAAERICSDGDSQAAPLLSRDGFVEITRHSPSGHRTIIRRFALDSFGSIADYLTQA